MELQYQTAMRGIANDLVNALVEQLETNGNVDTGFLKNSIIVKIEGTTLIIEMADYGEFIEFGTAPHIIKPKNKKALKFKSGDNQVFAKEVHHPGTRPSPFIRPVLHRKLKGIIVENLRRHLNVK